MADKKKKEITVKTVIEKPAKRAAKKKAQPTVRTLPAKTAAKTDKIKKGGKKSKAKPPKSKAAPFIAAEEKRVVAVSEKPIAETAEVKRPSGAGQTLETKAEKPKAKTIEKEKIRVMFVCTGNTCRSAMAEYIFKDYLLKSGKADEFDVSGAGLDARDGDMMSALAVQTLKERGIDGSSHRARVLTYESAEESDLIVCMTAGHKRAIGRAEKLKTVGELTGGADVPDPFGQAIEVYRRTADYLEYACRDIYDAAVKAVSKRAHADSEAAPR